MSVDRLDTKIRGPIPKPSEQDQRRAALTIAHHATSPEECLELLRMCGLAAAGFGARACPPGTRRHQGQLVTVCLARNRRSTTPTMANWVDTRRR